MGYHLRRGFCAARRTISSEAGCQVVWVRGVGMLAFLSFGRASDGTGAEPSAFAGSGYRSISHRPLWTCPVASVMGVWLTTPS